MHHFSKLIGAAVLAASFAGAAGAQSGPLAIGTNPQGSLAYASGSAIADVVGDATGSPFTVVPLGGPTAVIPALIAGEFDFGFANMQAASAAYDGRGPFEGRAQPDLRIAAVVYPLNLGVFTSERTDITDISQLEGARIPSEFTSQRNDAASMSAALAVAGLSYDDVQAVPVQSGSEAVQLLIDDQLDATIFSVGSGIVSQLDAAVGVRYLSLPGDDETRKMIEEQLRGATIATLPAGYATGIEEDTNVIQAPFVVMTSADVDDETVYEVVKALAENQASLEQITGQFRDLSLETMGQSDLPVPYHPGAIRFYEEQGVWE